MSFKCQYWKRQGFPPTMDEGIAFHYQEEIDHIPEASEATQGVITRKKFNNK